MNSERTIEADPAWTPITSEADWLELDGRVFGFHDGVIKELHWTTGEHVNSALEMVYSGTVTIRALIQLQLKDVPVVELRFQDVQECAISAATELEANVTLRDDAIVFLLSASGADRIIAKKCEYRLCGNEKLGPGPFNCIEPQ